MSGTENVGRDGRTTVQPVTMPAGRTRVWVTGAIFVLAVGGVLLAWNTMQRADREMRESVLFQARLIAQALDVGKTTTLSGTPADSDRPEYLRLKTHLAAVRQVCEECRSLYVVGRAQTGGLFFFVDDVPADSDEYSPPGHVYEETSDVCRRVFDTKVGAVEGSLMDRWGARVSAFVPIADPQTGDLVGVLGMDVGTATWRRAAVRAGLPILLTTAFLMVILLSGTKLLARRARFSGTPSRWMLYLEPTLVFVTGVTVTLFAAWTVDRRECHARDQAFALTAANGTDTLTRTLGALFTIRLEGLADFFEGSEKVTDAEFQQYTAHLTYAHEVQAWGWCPVVPAANKTNFEVETRAAGRANFEIWQRDPQGKRVPADGRNTYYPVLDIVPPQDHEALLGYDFGSNSSCRTALEELVHTGLPTVTDPVSLEPGSDAENDMFFFSPVFEKKHPDVISGVVTAKVSTTALLQCAAQDGSVLVQIMSLRKTGVPETVVSGWDPDRPPPTRPSFVRPVFAFGKTFAVTARAGDNFLRLYPRRMGWLVALTGLLLSATLALIVRLVLRRRTELECLVAERTANLRASEARLSATLHSIGDGVISCDCEGRVASLNEVAETLTGWSAAEAAGRPLEEVFRITDIETRTAAKNLVGQTLGKGAIVELADPMALVARDGTEYQIASSHAPIRDTTGTVLGTVIVFRDITEENRRRTELTEERRRLEFILGITKTGIDIIDGEFNLQYVDPAWRQVYGDPTGRKCYEYYMGADRPCAACGTQKALESKLPVVTEQTLPRENNRVVEVHSIPFQDVNGRWLIAEFNVDITERKKAQAVLLQTQFMVEHASDSIIWLGENGNIVYANESACASVSYSREELLTMTIFDIDPDFPLDNWEEYKKLLRRLGSVNFESRHRAKDGRVFPVEVRTNYFEFDGRFLACAFDHDISERKRAEEERERLQAQLAQSQKMESVGRLAGGIAHDFNNMLGVILGHTEFAMDAVDSSQPIFADLEEIQKAAERSADLTRQLLAFARKQTVAPRVLNLNETVEGTLKMLRRLIGEDIDLVWLPGVNVQPVKVDPSQIDQILANLCVNARDAIGDTGRITIETGTVIFDEDYCAEYPDVVPGEYILLAVSDDGCGMSPKILAHAFEPFFTTKETGKGTGLGLATVYGIVKQNGGLINVYSELNHGSSFKVYFPRYIGETESAQVGTVVETVEHGDETILLVEDEPGILKLTAKILRHLGYTVVCASAPGEAIRLAAVHAGKIQLLITDVVMPEMNGRDLARELLSLYPDIKRLFMSGYTASVIAQHGVLEENAYFIQKPFSKKELAIKVRQALGNK